MLLDVLNASLNEKQTKEEQVEEQVVGNDVGGVEYRQDHDRAFSQYDAAFQERVFHVLVHDREWAQEISEVMSPNMFDEEHLRFLSNVLWQFFRRYKAFPSVGIFVSNIKEVLEDIEPTLRSRIVSFLPKIAQAPLPTDASYIKDKVEGFCRRQNFRDALMRSVDLMKDEKYDSVFTIMKNAVSASTPGSKGHDFHLEREARWEGIERDPISTGLPPLDKVIGGGLSNGELGVVVAATGCHAAGTPILMFDGTIKNVEDVRVGDQLMGPDSQPRNVLQLARGRERMVRIVPTKGDSFVVNENHILSLVHTVTKEIVNIKVKDWELQHKTFKHCHKLYWSGEIDFGKNEELPVDPYFVGLLLGDGYVRRHRVELTTCDNEIAEYFVKTAQNEGVGSSKRKKYTNKADGFYLTNNKKHNNPLILKLEKIGILGCDSGDKFIPEIYKTASVKERLEILAGLIDTDGSLSNNCFEITLKSKQLVDDIAFVARSLGLRVTISRKNVKGCEYHRAFLTGDVDKVPTKLKRKQAAQRRQKKNALVSGFTVEEAGVDNFYGFSLDGDNLFLGGDFLVHHNTGKSHWLVNVGAQAVYEGKNVIHYTFELSEHATGRRYDSWFTNIDSNEILSRKDDLQLAYARLESERDLGKLYIKEYPTGTASVVTLKGHLERLRISGFIPDMIVVDYADIMKAASGTEGERFKQKAVYEELRALSKEMKLPIWTASQSNREGAGSEIITSEQMGESYGKAQVADLIVSLSRKPLEKANGTARMFVAKNRMGSDGFVFGINIDTARSQFEENEELMDLVEAQRQDAQTRKSFTDDILRETNNKWNKVSGVLDRINNGE